MFVGEEAEGRMTEIESREVIFLTEDYPTRGEIDKYFQFYEIKDPDNGAPSHSIEGLKQTFNLLKNSGSDFVPDPTPIKQDHEKSQRHQSTRERIPYRRFEIEGESFMIAPYDDEKPKNVNEALSGLKAKKWIKVMEEQMESMNANQVWDLVNLLPRRRSIGNK